MGKKCSQIGFLHYFPFCLSEDVLVPWFGGQAQGRTTACLVSPLEPLWFWLCCLQCEFQEFPGLSWQESIWPIGVGLFWIPAAAKRQRLWLCQCEREGMEAVPSLFLSEQAADETCSHPAAGPCLRLLSFRLALGKLTPIFQGL